MPNGVTIRLEETPAPADLEAIYGGLTAFNREQLGNPRFDPWVLFLRDEEGRIRGGTYGALFTKVAMVQQIWVEAGLRGRGYGRALLRAAEAYVAKQGVTFTFAEVMSFQAPGFFARCGYSSFGAVHGYRSGVCRDSVGKQVMPRMRRPAAKAVAPYALAFVQRAVAEERALVRAGVDAAAAEAGWPDDERPLVLVARVEQGRAPEVVGGLVGETRWGGCHVDTLWVSEQQRGADMGTRLMAAAEAEAQARGCTVAYLETMHFQARPFYEKLGYTLDWTLEHTRTELTTFGLSKPIQPLAAPASWTS